MREGVVYHTIEFKTDFVVDLEAGPKQPLERVLVRRGSRRRVQIRPYVVATKGSPVEVADLYFEDGTTTRRVPFAFFFFAE